MTFSQDVSALELLALPPPQITYVNTFCTNTAHVVATVSVSLSVVGESEMVEGVSSIS